MLQIGERLDTSVKYPVGMGERITYHCFRLWTERGGKPKNARKQQDDKIQDQDEARDLVPGSSWLPSVRGGFFILSPNDISSTCRFKHIPARVLIVMSRVDALVRPTAASLKGKGRVCTLGE